MLIFLNSHASYGRAPAKWQRVLPEIEARVGELEIREVSSLEHAVASVRSAVAGGERSIVAAGGDGTVNLLLNAIMMIVDEAASGIAEISDVRLGAVGLGSSNDFHKPFSPERYIAGVPIRIDCDRATRCDVIRVETEDATGAKATRYSMINSSIGITAEANASFNDPTRFIRAARRLSVDAAITAAVLKTLVTYRDIGCRLVIDGEDAGVFSVSNLGVIKNPHFGGAMCYDTPIEPDDGQLGINLCERLTTFRALTTLAALHRRRFHGRPGTRSWMGQTVRVEGDRAFALETDGEIVHAHVAEFTVLPRAILCCR